jgi:gliding motility-associated-like protein
MRKLYPCFFLACSLAFSFCSFGQYVVNGSASANSCHCFTLTQTIGNQVGSFWASNQMNLNNPFDFKFNVFLGCSDAGADGIVFILQPTGTNLSATGGGGLGYQNFPGPSLAVEIDTWQNPATPYNDPVFDHIAIEKNGSVDHAATNSNALSPAVQASATDPNVEDCQWHDFRVTWDPASQLLSVYFDNTLRTQYTGDIVTTIFSGNSMVYWGFVGSTGGANNLQQVCTVLQADFTTSFTNNTGCEGTPISFNDASQCFSPIQSSYWNFGDGGTSPLLNPPPHYYAAGSYVVKHTITGIDGCVSDTISKTITIGAKPVADFTVNDTCSNYIPQVTEQSSCSLGTITAWSWLLDGNPIPGSQQVNLPILPVGAHVLKLVVTSNYGCVSDTATRTFFIKPAPVVDFSQNAGCVNQPVQFSSSQSDSQTSIIDCIWDFADGTAVTSNGTHVYSSAGSYPVQLYCVASNGCRSPLVQHAVNIGTAPLVQFSVSDTCVGNAPLIINSSTIPSGSITQWNWTLNGQPFSSLQNPSISSALPAGNYILQLTAGGNTGCSSAAVSHNFLMKSSPSIAAAGTDGCYNTSLQFNASQTDASTTIQQWNWNFGDGQNSGLQNPTHIFTNGGNYAVTVAAIATNGCSSQQIQLPIKINRLAVNAGNDTTVVSGTPFTLNGSASGAINGSLNYLWSPANVLNNPGILQPSGVLHGDTVFTLTVQSAEGCIAKDSVRIIVFNGSAIYVPTGFTPNNDGLNDKLRPRYIGIKKLNYFSIYNRWGEKIFSTADMSKGWDGSYLGKEQNSGTFVWLVNAVGMDGKNYELKGTTTLIR